MRTCDKAVAFGPSQVRRLLCRGWVLLLLGCAAILGFGRARPEPAPTRPRPVVLGLPSTPVEQRMFKGFAHALIQTSDPEVKINLRYGGDGPPLLLLHGNPLTHVHWHRIVSRLAKDFTVVATDLRGYGDSSKPRGRADHSNYSFRRMAQDQVEVMTRLGFTQFFVAGHDRGARTAYRMALDHPDKVLKFASLDIIPTHYVLTHTTSAWALNSFHWFFMAQPYDIPEQFFAGKERYYVENKLTRMGMGKGGISAEALAEYTRCCTPESVAIHGLM